MQRFLAKSGLINICLVYRLISITVATSVYLLPLSQTEKISIGVALGMVAACFIASWLYRKYLTEGITSGMTVTIFLEVVAYGLFIFLSGGFASPYLWYFLSALTIVLAVGRFEIMVAAVLWCMACAFGSKFYWFPGESVTYFELNLAFGFLLLAGGFYLLFLYMRKLESSQKALHKLNDRLRREKSRSEQALSYTMDLYNTFKIFALSDPDKIMQELCELLGRTIAPLGGLLLRLNAKREIESAHGIAWSEEKKSEILGCIAPSVAAKRSDEGPYEFEAAGQKYNMHGVCDQASPVGILILPLREQDPTDGDEAQLQFYLNLICFTLRDLEVQGMTEAYIISEEQNRIASEIHDTVIQKLFGIVCSLHLLGGEQENLSAAESTARINEVCHVAESTMRELREAIYGMRWNLDGQDVFANRLKLYLEETERLSGAKIHFEMDQQSDLLNANQKTTFYRVICEAVNNAVRHGQASEVDVQLSLGGKDITARVRDNGRGFCSDLPPADGQGLKNMQRLASLSKGRLMVESAVQSGTEVRLTLPR